VWTVPVPALATIPPPARRRDPEQVP